MQFQILIYNNAEFVAALEDGLMEELDRTHATVIAELEATGELVSSEELSPEVALTVRTDPADGKRVRVTDGPFSESKEWVGGFYTVDVGQHRSRGRDRWSVRRGPLLSDRGAARRTPATGRPRSDRDHDQDGRRRPLTGSSTAAERASLDRDF